VLSILKLHETMAFPNKTYALKEWLHLWGPSPIYYSGLQSISHYSANC